MTVGGFRERLLKDALERFHYGLGNGALGRGDFEEAVILYRRGEAAGCGHAKLKLNLALTLERAGRAAEAAAVRAEAGAFAPRTAAEAWFDLAEVYEIQGATEQCLEALGRATALDPGYAEALHLYGHALRRAGRSDQAAAAFLAFAQAPDADFADTQYFQVGSLLQDLGAHEGARLAYARAGRMDPLNYGHHLGYGAASLEVGDVAAARAAARRAAAAYPSAHGVFGLLGWAADVAGDMEQAEAWHRLAVRRAGWRDVCHFNLAACLIRRNRGAEALEALAAAKRCPNPFPWIGPWIHLAVGAALSALGRAEEARAAFAAGADAGSEKGRVFYYLGPEAGRLRAQMRAALA